MLIAKTVSGEKVVIESGASVKNHQFQSSTFDIGDWNASTQAAGPGSAVIKTADLKIEADGLIGESSAPLGLKQVAGGIKLDIDNSGDGGVILHGKGSLVLTNDSSVSSSSSAIDALVISSDTNLTVPAGVSLSASSGSEVGDGGHISLRVDSSDSDASGGNLTYRGEATGWILNLEGDENSDIFDIDSSASDGIPVSIWGGQSDDTLNFDPAGLGVSHGATPQLLVSGNSPIKLFSVERVNGVAPDLHPIGPQTVAEGDDALIPYVFTDWGADEWDVTLTEIGGSVLVETTIAGLPSGLGPFDGRTLSYVFADNGEHDLQLCVTDVGDNGSACVTFHVSVGNADPVTEAGAGHTVLEGDIVSLDPATFNDPGTADTHTATIDWGDATSPDNGDVSETPFGPPGSTAGLNGRVRGSHAYADQGTGSYVVTVTVEDDDGGVSADSFTLTVNNAPPVVDAGDDVSIPEGSLFELPSVSFNDPGTADTHTATIDWGDGSAVEAGSVTESPFGPPGDAAGLDGTVDGSHTYADNGVFTVTVTVDDGDGGSDSDSIEVEVTNVLPLITPSGEPEVIIFSPLHINSPFSDPGFDCPDCPVDGTTENFTATIDWGDPTPIETVVISKSAGGPGTPTTGLVAGSHEYDWIGTYNVIVTITDDDGGSASFTHVVEVLGGHQLNVEARRVLTPFVGESKRIQQALKELDRVIDGEDWMDGRRWIDEVHLDPKHGHKIFTDQKKVVGHLVNALKDSAKAESRSKGKHDEPLTPEAIYAINEAIWLILISDRVLAEVAIGDAESATVLNLAKKKSVDHDLAKAGVEMGKAQAEIDKDHLTHVIDRYRKAWNNAQSALKHASAPAPKPKHRRGDDDD